RYNTRVPQLTIGQLAKRAGLATSTLRYYEEQGLLLPAARSSAGYRLYAPQAEQTLLFIQRAQRLGFSLQDIRVLLDRLEHGPLVDEAVATVAEERYTQIERQLTELMVLRHEMGVFLRNFRHPRAGKTADADVYMRLLERICGHEHDTAHSTLSWLLTRSGCALANIERDRVLEALAGRHVHIWRDGSGYRILVPSLEPAVAQALEEIARIETACHTHATPQLERTEEGYVLSADGPEAYLFAQLFMALENAPHPPAA
ncbi:MAG TPA: MerR family transcriptional regulator, partial [Gammaproteobacteria bacterium]|nr:MerR family transcriptional regulator [Gammaproteobacteria bacterium]